MSQISQKALKKKVSDQIHKKFINTMINLANREKDVKFLEELFTYTEKIMFAKRIAAIFLLAQGFSQYRVWKLLLMSPATTAKLQNSLDSGKYSYIKEMAQSRKNRKEFLVELETFIRFGMPSMGKDRWKWLNESKY